MQKLMSIQKINLAPSTFKWALERPSVEINFDTEKKELFIGGWVAHESSDEITILIEGKEYELNVDRPDVLKAIYTCNDNKVLRCGFKHNVKLNDRNFKIGIKSKNSIEWVCSVEIVNKLKVLIGKDDWLFLDNDTNSSVSQFQGESIITQEGMLEYNLFFENVKELSAKYGFKWSFGVAPAKEFMLEEFYPHQRGDLTVIEQITSFADKYKEVNLFFDKLKASSSFAYWKGDTHWTDYGGFIAVMSLLEGFGIDVPDKYFKTNYSIVAASGDLSIKVPHKIPGLLTVVATNMHAPISFNNGIINHGNVKVYVNENSLIDKTCVIFAGSSAAWMVKFLSKIFRRLVSVHTAGSIDEAIIKNEMPDYIIINMNSRFLIRPPTTGLNFSGIVASKPSGHVTENSNVIDEKDIFYRNMIKS